MAYPNLISLDIVWQDTIARHSRGSPFVYQRQLLSEHIQPLILLDELGDPSFYSSTVVA